MKKVIILLLLVTATMTTTYGQSAKFGLKGGLNFGSTGGLSTFSAFTDNLSLDPEDRLGYHVGVFGKIKLLGIFIQPEVVYTKLNTEFKGDTTVDYAFSKIDIPVLLGFDIVGPFNIKAGPSFQLVIDNEIEGLGIALEDPENSFTVGYQLGAGLQLGRLGLDLRYEGAFQDNNVISDTDVQDFGFIVDSRPSQWILSVSYILEKGKNE